MRKNKILILIGFIVVSFNYSCVVVTNLWAPEHFTLKHEDKDTGIGNFINLNGYYFPVDSNNEINQDILLYSKHERVLFYRNGIVCLPPFYPTMEVYNENYKKTSMAKTIWGSYSFDEKEKLIHTQTILDLGAMSSMWVVKETFKIKDSTHIVLVDRQIDDGKIFEVNMEYEFVEEPNILDFSTNWLLKKKWFWKKGAKK